MNNQIRFKLQEKIWINYMVFAIGTVVQQRIDLQELWQKRALYQVKVLQW